MILAYFNLSCHTSLDIRHVPFSIIATKQRNCVSPVHFTKEEYAITVCLHFIPIKRKTFTLICIYMWCHYCVSLFHSTCHTRACLLLCPDSHTSFRDSEAPVSSHEKGGTLSVPLPLKSFMYDSTHSHPHTHTTHTLTLTTHTPITHRYTILGSTYLKCSETSHLGASIFWSLKQVVASIKHIDLCKNRQLKLRGVTVIKRWLP